MKHNYFKSNQCEEMARNLWVYLYTQMGVKSAKSMSAGSEAEGRKTEGRASNEHPLSIHSASIEHPLQVQGKSVKMPLHFLRYAAMIFMLFMVGIGNVWGTVLETIDFSESKWSGVTFTQGNTDTYDVHNGVTFNSKNSSKKFSISDGKLTFPSNNISSGNYSLGFPVTGIVGGTVTIKVYNGSTATQVKYTVKDGGTSYSTSDCGDGTNTWNIESPTLVQVTGLEDTKAFIYIGRSSSSYTTITKIEVLSPSLTDLSTSTFYTLYNTSASAVSTLISAASFPSYIMFSSAGSIDSNNGCSSSVSTPHNFSALVSGTTYKRIKTAATDKLIIEGVSNAKSIRLYGNGNGGTKSVPTVVTKVSGTGSVMSISSMSMENSPKAVAEYTTGDLTAKSGYNASTYYTYTISFPANCDIWGIYVEAAPSCAAANLTAANITSNGDQEAGTGITFSKVGSPASGDTWYWQTSATGTDKTHNAASEDYTTATTAGSYTVYLRAYNTAADCWGTAIGKTNSVYSCPLDVYNGENVDKGNTTASGWTINNSSTMAKQSGTSNGYSYWYQASSNAGDHVQFDGSFSVASGDQIKIQWTHTNGSNKTLQLYINDSSASLTSGSQANSSNLVEAVYDVTSAITVTSIKLKSSGSSGCIIYQVSIVKAACAEPSCSDDTGLAYGETTVNKTYGDGSFTNTLTNSNSLSVTYSSSNTNVATVNESTGAVTIAGAGTTTITATWAGNATYCADEVSYTLNVKPNAVVDATNANGWRYTIGETIDLTCTATGGSSYTYQWQKYTGPDTWTNLSNGTDGGTFSGVTTNRLQISGCTSSNGGSYRCLVTANGQTKESNAYVVYIFTLNGNYDDDSWTENAIVWTGANTGRATINLSAGRTYKFKVTNNDGKWFGCNTGVTIDMSNWTFRTNEGDCVLTTGGYGGGAYTFDIDISYAGDNNITVSVTYPKKTTYLQLCSDWKAASAKYAIYYWKSTYDGWTDFMTAFACDGDVLSADVPVWATNCIIGRFNTSKASTGNWDDLWNQTGDLTLPTDSKDYYHTLSKGGDNKYYGSWGTYSPSTYTITFAGNDNTGGSMSSISSIACDADQQVTANAFEKTGYTFANWTANVDVKVGGATVSAGSAIANSATIQNVSSDIALTAQWSPIQYDVTLEKGSAPAAGTSGSAKVYYDAAALTNISHATWAGHELTGYYTSNSGGTKVLNADGTFADANVSGYITDNKWTRAENTTVKAQWTAKTTTITINANTANHGSTAPSPITATYGSALPSFTAATGASGWNLTGYFTEATSGTKIINANGTLVASTDYADGDGNWNSEVATLTLYAQYEEEGCTPQSVVKTVLSSTTAGSTTGYNNDEYAGSATIVTFQTTPIDGGYKMQSGSKLFVTLKKGNFVEGDKINIVITKASDLTNAGKVLIFYDASSPKLLTKIDASAAGTFTYTLTAANITTLGSTKTIGVYRPSSGDNVSNPYVKSVEVEGCRDWTVDETAPTFVSSVPANGATGVATSGTIVLTFSEALGSVDASKFTLTGATKGAVAIDGSDATKVNIAYSGAANEASVTLATAAAAVSDLAGNALAAALSNISFTTAAAAPAGDCITIAYFETTSHSNSSSKPDNAGKYIYGYTNSAKTEAYAYTITSSTGDNKGQGTGESDYLRMNYGTTVTIYADNTTTGGTPASFSNVTSVSVDFKMKNSAYYTSFDIYVGSTKIANNVSLEGAAQSAFTTFTYDNLEQLSGTVRIVNKGSGSSNYHFYVDNIEICTSSLPACTTPELPTLTAKTVCEGGDADAAWNAAITNSGSLVSGETVAYSWVKKGGSTPVSSVATYQPTDVTEAMAGTYVVTATVSADGKASKSASQEVDLSVTEGTEAPTVTQSATPVYEGNSVTLTATATTGATYTWHTCNADGTGESSAISGATTNAYTITSARAAGTYYYKAVATGDGTHSCGTAEYVYTLVVSAPSECETHVWWEEGAPTGQVQASCFTFGSTPSGSNNQSLTMTIDGTDYTCSKRSSNWNSTITFTIPTGSTGTFYICGKGTNDRTITLTDTESNTSTFNMTSTYGTFHSDELAAGTWTVTSSGNIHIGMIGLHVCRASTCTDATPVATAANTTVCSGTALSITATDYEESPTNIQWQKLNGSVWSDISGATSATYSVASAAAENAGSYRVIVTKECARTSNTVTIAVPSAPVFGEVPASVSIMQTLALSISTVEATDAVKYRWYKSADATWDAGDVEIGTDQTLIKAYGGETAGSTYYVFCRAQNACGITTSSAIAVNVTTYVEEDCATKGNEGEAQFGFENTSCSQGTYSETAVWTTNSRSKYLTYTAPEGKYLKTAKVTVAVSSGSKCGYAYSTDGGTTWTYAELASLSSTLTEKAINLNSLSGTINAFRISRNLQDGGGTDHGVTSGNFYLSKACFEYTDACTATTVTVSPTSKTYTIGNSWTAPTITLDPVAVASETLTYTSSDEDIATVDDDGTVNFQGRAGSVTITASYAGGEVGLTDYCASEGSYTITVSCSDEAPKVVPASGTNMSGCNSSVTLNAKMQNGTSDFGSGTYQWFRDGEEISGATSSSYIAVQAGVYTVERTGTGGCTSVSTNSAVVTSTTTEPEVERLVPFQYYHVNKTYTAQMKMRHLFAVKNSGTLDGKHFKMYVSRNGAAATDVTSSNALVVWPSDDGHVDTVMVNLNELSGKYSENDELVYTCKAIDCSGNVSETYKDEITMHVIGATPTLALICSGSNKEGGTRKTGELTVGGDFLTGYNKADLCQQTGKTSFDASQEWGLYTELKAEYLVTPVNGYANFYKLNYEPFDLLFLTDYPKASKSDAAATVLDDMAELVDFRPFFSFKTHMVHKSPSKWAAKGFTTSPTENKADGRLYLNIVCYAHPMFTDIKSGDDFYNDADDASQLVYKMLSGTGYENSKGMQGFEIDAAENFVTIGLTHYNGTAAPNNPGTGKLKWTPASGDRMLVSAAERQANLEARMILFSLNAGAHSMLTDKGELVVLKCLEYLISDAADPLTPVADCSLTFDDATGDGKWSTPGNWGPNHINIPGEFNSARIAAPVTVDIADARALELRIIESGHITIPAGSALQVTSTVRRMDGHEISPTENSDIFIGSTAAGNGTLIFNNDKGDSKATVAMYTTAVADIEHMSAATSTWQYIGTPHNDVAVARNNYYDSWLYQYDTGTEGWTVIPNGGPLVPFRGYCVTHPEANHTFVMEGTLTATGTADIDIPAGKYVVVANSWVAPIDIHTIEDDDMEGITDKSIYFFNTGSDTDGSGTSTESATGDARWAAGTYVSVPIHSAPYTDGSDDHIPSMQGFYVVGGSSDGALHLDYDKHVRGQGRGSILSGRMHAPRRTAAESDEPNVLKIFARGSRYDDRLIVLEREDFTRGYDSGWDGEAWGGSNLSPMVYVIGEGREDAVSAIPEFEGTVIAFKAGEDSEYRFEFVYSEDAEPLYLLDTENNTYTQVMTGNAYYFTTTDKVAHSRFILTRKAPQIATGTELTSDGEGAKARKLLIEDKMYILLNGMLYDATGKVVK